MGMKNIFKCLGSIRFQKRTLLVFMGDKGRKLKVYKMSYLDTGGSICVKVSISSV